MDISAVVAERGNGDGFYTSYPFLWSLFKANQLDKNIPKTILEKSKIIIQYTQKVVLKSGRVHAVFLMCRVFILEGWIQGALEGKGSGCKER